MKRFSLPKEYCLWLVPSNGEGKVVKVRIQRSKILAIALAVLLLAGGLGFAGGDYARLQLARAKDYLWLQMVRSERDRLLRRNQNLHAEMEALRASNLKVLGYEQSIKQKIEALAALVEGTTAVTISKNRETFAARKGERAASELARRTDAGGVNVGGAEDGVGGLEVAPEAQARLSPRALQDHSFSMLYNRAESEADANLARLLDEYHQLLNSTPLGAPSEGFVSSGYGMRISPFSGKLAFHPGTDISAPYGTPVYATGDGVVTSVQRGAAYGLWVEIQHSSRLETRYAHLSAVTVKVGQRVRRGTKLGNVGNSGRSTGPHLHYEVRVDSASRNPRTFIELAERLTAIITPKA